MKLKNFLLIFIAVLLGVILGISLIYLFNKKPKYAVLVFRSGNIYFGKISWFPKPKLSSVVFLQIDQTGQASLQKFSNAVYRPKDFFYFNPNEVLFWSYLENDSPLINLIESKNIAPVTQPTSSQTLQGSQTTSTPTSISPTPNR